MSRALAISTRFLALSIAWAACSPALASCPSPSWFERNWLVTYDGTIGDRYAVRMTLVFDGDSLTGKYFYTRALKDIRIEGTVRSDRSLTLNEFDDKGAITARFVGRFPEEDPKEARRTGRKLGCEVMLGDWESLSSDKTFPFYLRLAHAVAGSLSKRYRDADVDDDTVESLAQSFLRAVRENDRNKVASLVEYPFSLSFLEDDRPRSITIRSKAELLRNYESLFGSAYKEQLEGAIPKHMF